jgi:hypothetical protein
MEYRRIGHPDVALLQLPPPGVPRRRPSELLGTELLDETLLGPLVRRVPGAGGQRATPDDKATFFSINISFVNSITI